MSNNDTPTPWHVTELTRRPVGLQYHWRIQVSENRDSELIAVIPAEYPGDDAGEAANAEFIVRAVNAHDELVAALKRADEALTDIRTHWKPVSHPNDTPNLVQSLESAVAMDHSIICNALIKAKGAA